MLTRLWHSWKAQFPWPELPSPFRLIYLEQLHWQWLL